MSPLWPQPELTNYKYTSPEELEIKEVSISSPKAVLNNTATLFSPPTFEEYIGQDSIKKILRITIKAAKIENRTLPSMLITGEFGLGKTTLAKLILKEYRGDNRVTIEDANKVELLHLPTSGTIIIDEIHNLSREIMDSLNIILDEGNLSIIGCTTDSGELSAPFRSRFNIYHLESYSVEDLIQIVTYYYQKKPSIVLNPEQVVQIALRSRFNPRQAIQNLNIIFDLMAVNEMFELTDEIMNEAFDLMGLDNGGLRPIDRKYLNVLRYDTPVGIQYIAAMIGSDSKTIMAEIEPYLMRRGLIERTSKGRKLAVPPSAIPKGL